MQDISKMLSISDASSILNVHVNTIRNWIYKDKIKAVHIGRSWKISKEEVERIKREGVIL